MSLNPQESIDILNLARSMELVAIGQYMQHHYALTTSCSLRLPRP